MSLPPAELQYQTSHIHDDKGLPVVVATAVFGFLALLTLAVRFGYRIARPHTLGFDDYLMFAAAVFGFGECLSTFELYRWGTGRHLIAVPIQDLVPWSKWNLVLGFCYSPAMLLAKLSILALIYRVFSQGSKLVRYGVWTIVVYTFLWTIAVLLIIGLSCRPFNTYWSVTAPCSPSETPTTWTAAFNTVGDFSIILLPQASIWSLQMTLGRKLAVSILMCLGVFATVCGIVRIVMAKQLNPFDATYTYANVGLFFVLEVLVTIICANLPTINQPLLATWNEATKYISRLSDRSTSLLNGSRKSDRSDSKSWNKVNDSRSYLRMKGQSTDIESGPTPSSYPMGVIKETTEVEVSGADA